MGGVYLLLQDLEAVTLCKKVSIACCSNLAEQVAKIVLRIEE